MSSWSRHRIPGPAPRCEDETWRRGVRRRALTSRWLTALAGLVADPARGGFHRFNARVVRGLPIPPAESPAWRTLAAAGASGGADDAWVADLYHLDAADRRVLAPLAPLAAGAADSL